MNTDKTTELIKAEREYQNAKWGISNPHTDSEWIIIATEEAGEIARTVLDLWNGNEEVSVNRQHLVHELVQHAAVLVAWIEERTADMPDEEIEHIIHERKAKTAALINARIGRSVVEP